MDVHGTQSDNVYDNFDEAFLHRALYIIPSEHSPGFCLIQNTKHCESGGLVLLSSRRYREDILKNVYPVLEKSMDIKIHGPCLSKIQGTFEYDFAICFQCPRWPILASEWTSRRRRYGWPSTELIEKITRSGCHFVSIGNPESPLSDFEWRMSFSLAERTLIHEFRHVQFLVYNLLKLVLKRVINVRVPDVLCSYFVKTAMFYTIENTSPALWSNDKVDECYKKSLSSLYQFIDTMNCPNYFFPDNNMMKRKVNSSNRAPLLDIVTEMMTRGIQGALHLCDESYVLSPYLTSADIEFHSDYEFLTSYLLAATRVNCYIPQYLTLLPVLLTRLRLFRDGDSSFLNILIELIFVRKGLKTIQEAELERSNRSRYTRLKFGMNLLRRGCSTDISSGRLQLTTYMFIRGRFHDSLAIIKIVLSKFSPYVMTLEADDEAVNKYKEVLCNKGYHLANKLKKGWAINVMFPREYADLTGSPFPLMLLLIITGGFSPVPALLYAYFLQGLCFYKHVT